MYRQLLKIVCLLQASAINATSSSGPLTRCFDANVFILEERPFIDSTFVRDYILGAKRVGHITANVALNLSLPKHFQFIENWAHE